MMNGRIAMTFRYGAYRGFLTNPRNCVWTNKNFDNSVDAIEYASDQKFVEAFVLDTQVSGKLLYIRGFY